MKKILLITHQRGYECDTIIDKLNQENIEFFRYNLDLETDDLSKVSFLFGEKVRIVLECDGKKNEGDNFGAAYCHQTLPEMIYDSDAELATRRIRENAFSRTLFCLEEILNLNWVNKPSAIRRGSNKISQLAIASVVGFKTPFTLVSNSPTEIKSFSENRETIIKNLASPKYFSGDGYFEAETIKFSKEFLNEPDILSFAPIIYQQEVSKNQEVRVVFVGGEIFGAACQSDGQYLDYRTRPDIKEIMHKINLPEDICSKICSMMCLLGLQYGSFDFLINENQEYIFLELNPMGAFGWIDKVYEGEIYKAMVGLLKAKLQK